MADDTRIADELEAPSSPPVSQGKLVWKRFLSNKLAVASAILFILILIFSISAIGLGPIPGWWRYNYKELNDQFQQGAPTWLHPFGQDRIGKDYFALTMRGIQNSILVMVVLGLIASVVGVVVGAVAGYFRGVVDAILMRITDVFIVIPALVIGSVVGHAFGGPTPS